MQNIDTSALAAAKAKLDAAEAQREEVLLRHIANGVDIRSRNVEIGSEVVIAPGAVILAGTILRGKTTIGAGCVIGPNTLIEDSTVDEGTTVNASQVYSSHLGPHNNIGPFTHVRINTVTGYGVHLGAYVETKNSNFARGNTVSHLTYIGDSDVGKYCNFGCGTVTCNYDGKDKFRTQIGDYCFIGCNTNLVAPVTIGDGAYTAAGSTITKDVPPQALGIAGSRRTSRASCTMPACTASKPPTGASWGSATSAATGRTSCARASLLSSRASRATSSSVRVTASARMAGATGTENPPSPWAASFRLASVRQAG